jgi:CRISPR system Cascade subunit CasA
MNLLIESWMPVRKRDGSREWIAPNRLSDPEVVAFDANRADFNGALAQFAIGLLQTMTPIDSPIEWRKLFREPPDAATLENWFAPVMSAFEFDGDGARFMQDLSLTCADVAPCGIDALLIESPGENTLKNNADHFIKRGGISSICPHCAATALFTLQINAPSGGAGHRTGLRGGGPLTTLLLNPKGASLWQDIWLNVEERQPFLDRCGDKDKQAPHLCFPWLADISVTQNEGGQTAPAQVHPGHVFWAMPRRMRLDFAKIISGCCDICGRESTQLLTEYITRNYGLNYKGSWDHPLSPYYEAKEGWLPLHPQPGGIGYRHWLSWVIESRSNKNPERRAHIVDHFFQQRTRIAPGALRLWAFGYDMDKMKARCWYESMLPLYGLADCEPDAQKKVESEVGCWLSTADLAVSYLRGAVKDAWFSRDARGDFSAVDAAFWSCTEPQFYAQLKSLIESAQNSSEIEGSISLRENWLRCITGEVLKLFDEDFVGAGQVERQNPKRAAEAFQQLKRNLDGPKIRLALGLPAAEKTKTKRSTKKNTAAV